MMNELEVGSKFNRRDVPTGTRIWTGRWCRRRNGERVRCIYVIRQYKWIAGKNDEHFAPTPGHAGVRILLAVGLAEDDEFVTGDVSVAFMHTDLDESVYVEAPPELGFGKDFVWKLNRALNGLQRASQLFTRKVVKLLNELNFTGTRANPVILRNPYSGVKIGIHVDDPLAVGKRSQIDSLFKELGARLKFREGICFGPVQPCVFLGSAYLRPDRETIIEMPKPGYFERTLSAMEMGGCSSAPTPGTKEWNSPKLLRSQNHSPLSKEDHSKFRSGVVKLQYGVDKRIDYSHELKMLGRALQNPTEFNMTHLKRVLRYVAGTLDYVQTRTRPDTLKLKTLCGRSDSDWANDIVDRKSTSVGSITWGGFLIMHFVDRKSFKLWHRPPPRFTPQQVAQPKCFT